MRMLSLTKTSRNTFPPNNPSSVWFGTVFQLESWITPSHNSTCIVGDRPKDLAKIPHGDRGRSAISMQGGPLIDINGVLTPYKWPDINKWRWLGWFHPWVFGPSLGMGGSIWGILGGWNRSKNSSKNRDVPNVRNPMCSRTLTWTPKHVPLFVGKRIFLSPVVPTLRRTL